MDDQKWQRWYGTQWYHNFFHLWLVPSVWQMAGQEPLVSLNSLGKASWVSEVKLWANIPSGMDINPCQYPQEIAVGLWPVTENFGQKWWPAWKMQSSSSLGFESHRTPSSLTPTVSSQGKGSGIQWDKTSDLLGRNAFVVHEVSPSVYEGKSQLPQCHTATL